jgi:putative endonuclease
MLGEKSEDAACRFLKTRGYDIVARNWRARVGEIDIIAREGDVLAFVEVKARSGDGFGGPEAAVHRNKQRRIILTAMAFVAATRCDLPMRFDVVAIQPGRVRLHRDAFQVPA